MSSIRRTQRMAQAILTATISIMLCPIALTATVELVQNGCSRAVLVVSKEASRSTTQGGSTRRQRTPMDRAAEGEFAAEEIQKHIAKMSGARLEIIAAGEPLENRRAMFIGSAADSAGIAAGRTTVTATGFLKVDSPTAGIQEAADALPRTGGTVSLPAGEHVLRQSIHLRSNVTLEGAGSSTVLRKKKHAESRLAAVAQQGNRSVQVVDANGFCPGDQVAVRDKDAMGWNVVQAVVTAVQGTELTLDRRMPRTCDATKMGFVIHAFPAITAERASGIVIQDLAIKDDAIRNLDIYGPLDSPRAKWAVVLPFHLAAIHLNFVADARVQRCSVTGWLSDGISVQGGSVTGPSAGHNTVTDCVVEKCGGIGFHPGGGLRDSVFAHNISRGNGGDGLYFCAGVQRVIVSESQFISNG